MELCHPLEAGEGVARLPWPGGGAWLPRQSGPQALAHGSVPARTPSAAPSPLRSGEGDADAVGTKGTSAG